MPKQLKILKINRIKYKLKVFFEHAVIKWVTKKLK